MRETLRALDAPCAGRWTQPRDTGRKDTRKGGMRKGKEEEASEAREETRYG